MVSKRSIGIGLILGGSKKRSEQIENVKGEHFRRQQVSEDSSQGCHEAQQTLRGC